MSDWRYVSLSFCFFRVFCYGGKPQWLGINGGIFKELDQIRFSSSTSLPVPPLGTQNDLGVRISRIFFYLCNQCDDILEVHADQTSVALIFLGSVFGENGQAPLRPQSDNNNNNSKRKRKHLWVSLYAYVDRSIIQSYLGEEPLW